MESLAAILGHARRKGVELWADKGRLHYRAPAGALTKEELERLRRHGPQIVAFLERSVAREALEPGVGSSTRRDQAPLAFSQLAHWNLFKLGERRGVRHVAFGVRLRGRLDPEVLNRSIAEVVRRHDALRTQIALFDGTPMQIIRSSSNCQLGVEDLSELSESARGTEVQQRMLAHALQRIDVSTDPLFSARLLRLCADEHVMLVAMEHMIADGRSRGILLREMAMAYSQMTRGVPLTLPAVAIQFTDYAVWQRQTQIPLLEKRIAYWQARMASCPGARFPTEIDVRAEGPQGLGIAEFRIEPELKAELLAWCRRRGTTLVMSACTAYFALIFLWCEVSDAVIRYQTDGRFSEKVANTIGYFAFPLYLRVQLNGNDRLADLLDQVTDEYARAMDHADFSYLEAQVPRLQFTRASRFNWVSLDPWSNPEDRNQSQGALACSRVYVEARVIEELTTDDDPTIIFSETSEEIRGSIAFSLHRFTFDAMETFSHNFLEILRALLRRPEARVRDLRLV